MECSKTEEVVALLTPEVPDQWPRLQQAPPRASGQTAGTKTGASLGVKNRDEGVRHAREAGVLAVVAARRLPVHCLQGTGPTGGQLSNLSFSDQGIGSG